MKLVEQAEFSPGACVLSDSSEGPFIDSERFDNFGNRLYACRGFVLEGAELLGALSVEHAAELRAALARSQAEIERLQGVEAQLAELQHALTTTLHHGGTIDGRGKIHVKGLSAAQRDAHGFERVPAH